jgi:sulfur carrier protein
VTTIVLNGAPLELDDGATVVHAIDATGAAAARSGLAVAVDGEVVPRGEWERTALRDDQRVEVLQAVQGGA